MSASEKISRAKVQLLLAHPWWATLLLNLRTEETERVPTMATDGTWLYYNPKFTESLPDKQVQGVLMHEVAHCALLHPFRKQWRDHMLWNIACDAAANALLMADGIELPANCVPPAPMDKTAEQIYDEMLKSAKKFKAIPQDVFGPGELSPKEGNGSSSPVKIPAADSMTEAKWRDVLASSRSLEPGNISRSIDRSREILRDWKEELAEFMYATHRADAHTWNRRSRRLPGMPGWKREPESTIAVCIDTSGSIDGEQLSVFASEAQAITALGGMRVYLITGDAAVGQVVEPGEDWPKEFTGGGGTDFRPVVARAVEFQPNAIVYFTDGCGDFPLTCDVPILWALTQPCNVPIGKSIQIRRN